MFSTKLIISGQFIEFYKYELPGIIRGGDKPSAAFLKQWKEECGCDEKTPEEKALSSFYRSRKNARRIIFSNAWEWLKENKKPYPPFFLTLTFENNIQDLKLANRIFSKFIQRFNYKLTNAKGSYLQYIGVVEFQKRGTVHYHIIIFNLPYIRKTVYKTIRELWGQGRIDLRMVKKTKTLVSYLSKYMVKESESGKLSGKKRYFTSRNIKRPIILTDPYHVLTIVGKIKDRLIYEKIFKVDFVGDINYKEFLLKPNESILDFNLDPSIENNVSSLIKK